MSGSGCSVLIKCLHGFFIFEERKVGQISDFMSLFEGLEIVRSGALYTFASLADAPRYSIEGGEYLGAAATVTIEGEPWEIMRANKLVYDFDADELVPIASISRRVQLEPTANAILSPGLIMPGSLTEEGERVKDYAAWYLFDTNRFKYSEVNSEDT